MKVNVNVEVEMTMEEVQTLNSTNFILSQLEKNMKENNVTHIFGISIDQLEDMKNKIETITLFTWQNAKEVPVKPCYDVPCEKDGGKCNCDCPYYWEEEGGCPYDD